MTETQKRVRRAVADLIDSTLVLRGTINIEGLYELRDEPATLAEARRELATISEELRAKADA